MPEFGDASAAAYALLKNGTYGLDAIETLLETIRKGVIQENGTELPADKSLYDVVVKDNLEDATNGLAALRALVDDLETRLTAARAAKLDYLDVALSTIRTELTFQHQAPAQLVQAAPVLNTWYTALDTVANALIYGIYFWVATTGETLSVRVTIDGRTLLCTFAAIADTGYYITLPSSSEGLSYTTTDTGTLVAFIIQGRSVKVEIRKTTNNGSGNLTCYVTYGKR